MKILIGEISSYKAIVISKFIKLNYNEVIVYTYDYIKSTAQFRTRYSDKHTVFKKQDNLDYIKALGAFSVENNIDHFFPVHSDLIETIIENKQLFGNALNYMGDKASYVLLHNKDLLLNIASNLGIDTPSSYNNIRDAVVPFVAKPTNKSSSNGVQYFMTESSKTHYVGTDPVSTLLYQEFIEGVGCGYSAYIQNGKISSGYGHKRLAEFPITGGSSVYRETFFDTRMKSVADKLFSKIKWSGFAMLEFKLMKSGRLVLIEVNPRIWGSINQGLQNGINYFESLLGPVDKKPGKEREIKTYLSPLIYLSFVKYIMNFNMKPVEYFIKNIGKNKPDISFLSDCGGFMSLLLRRHKR